MSATSCWRTATCRPLRCGGLSTGAARSFWCLHALGALPVVGLSGLVDLFLYILSCPMFTPAQRVLGLPEGSRRCASPSRGYLVNEEVERAVWGRGFKAVLPRGAHAADCGLLLTEPLLNLPSIQASTAQVGHTSPARAAQPHPMHQALLACNLAKPSP